MKSAQLSLTTFRKETVAPVIVAFTTGDSRTEYASSDGQAGSHMLLIRFINTEKLEARKNEDIFATTPSEFGSSEEVLETDAKQSTCGQIFSELWSNDDEGFPMPTGCYYGKKFRDATEGTASLPWREVMMKFSPKNGIKHRCKNKQNDGTVAVVDCQYQMVMNAAIGSSEILMGEMLVDIYAR